jgi:hypothetical protein
MSGPRAWHRAASRCALAVAAAAVAVPAASGCAGYGDDHADPGDAGPPDAAGACVVSLSIEPTLPEAPATIVAAAALERGGAVGVERLSWRVTRIGGGELAVEPRSDARTVAFRAEAAGAYAVAADAEIGTQRCVPTSEIINVRAPGAAEVSYRMRFVPRVEQLAPPQEVEVVVPGGQDVVYFGVVSLAAGERVVGEVEADTGAPLDAFLRLSRASGAIEAFARSATGFELRALPGAYELLVVPEGESHAPLAVSGVVAADLRRGLTVSPGASYAGRVVRADGSPLAGARVAARIAGLPTTLATTDANGAFAVRGRAAGGLALTVVPPAPALPALQLVAGQGLAAAASQRIDVAYTAAAAPVAFAPTVLAADGVTPVAGARLSLSSEPIAAVGEVASAGLHASVDGRVATGVVADAAGGVSAVELAAARYEVVVTAPTGGVGLFALDLAAGAPARLVLPPPAVVTGTAPSAGRGRVTAIPRDGLARAGAPTVAASLGDGGAFRFELVAGGRYELVVDPAPGSGRAPARVGVVAPAPGGALALGALVLAPAARLLGRVDIAATAGPDPGVGVLLVCGGCAGEAAVTPIAEIVTGRDGGFELVVPDPGVAQPMR